MKAHIDKKHLAALSTDTVEQQAAIGADKPVPMLHRFVEKSLSASQKEKATVHVFPLLK